MVNVSVKRCRCGKALPSFGEDGGKAVCCKRCKSPHMVDVRSSKCLCGRSQPDLEKLVAKLCVASGARDQKW